MNLPFWIVGALCVAALASILSGMWFLIGGPYMIAYILLAAGTGMLVAALIMTSFRIIRNKANKTSEITSP